MKLVEVNKYPPKLFRSGEFRTKDWISPAQIGAVIGGHLLTKDEYLRVEDRYVRVVFRFMQAMNLEQLHAHKLESWDSDSEELRNLGLADLFENSPPPQEFEPLA